MKMLKFSFFSQRTKICEEGKEYEGGSFNFKKKLELGSLVLLKSKNWPTLILNSFFNFPTLSIKYEVGNLVSKIYLSKNCS
jgi:hypothetical protein